MIQIGTSEQTSIITTLAWLLLFLLQICHFDSGKLANGRERNLLLYKNNRFLTPANSDPLVNNNSWDNLSYN
jgi:hypothetical protein